MPGSTVTRALELASAAAERTTAATEALLALTVSGGLIQLRRATPASWRRAVWLAALATFAASAYGRLARLERPGAATMAAALGVSLAAGAVQASEGLSVQVIWVFDHNGLFHLVQLAGVVLLIRGLMLSLQPVRP